MGKSDLDVSEVSKIKTSMISTKVSSDRTHYLNLFQTQDRSIPEYVQEAVTADIKGDRPFLA
jgi:hypothetical protein